VYEGTFAERSGSVVIVSSDTRNAEWPSVLAAPVLSMGFAYDLLETTVELGNAEPVVGIVVTDLIFPITTEELRAGRLLGPVSAQAIARLDEAIAKVFGLI
jgi:mRNA-degrading endonuclease toxin of MazEF toxin-antitoxin module